MLVILLSPFHLVGCLPSPPPMNEVESSVIGRDNTAILLQGNSSTVWNHLQRTSKSHLAEMQKTTPDPVQSAWIDLALLSKRNSLNTPEMMQALLAWRIKNPHHPGNALIPNNKILNQLMTMTPPRQIAILLPQHGKYASSGQKVRAGLINAYYRNLPKIGAQNVKFYDTTQDAGNLDTLYQQARNEGADFIIGPLTKEEVKRMKRYTSFDALTLALNYTEGYDRSLPTHFYEFGLLPEDEVNQMAAEAREAGLSEAILIAPKNAWGERLSAALSKRWQASGGVIKDTWHYALRSNFNEEVARLLKVDIKADTALMRENNHKTTLEEQRRQDFDVIFLFSQPKEARVIVPLLRYYYANSIPIYASASVYYRKMVVTNDADLKGVIVCDIPWGNDHTQETAPSNRLYAVGKDAYLLSQTLPRLAQLPHFPLYGKTGALTLGVNHQIHRRLPCRAI